jgi:uncharacterized membrane protein HdeD (DUF308 family)
MMSAVISRVSAAADRITSEERAMSTAPDRFAKDLLRHELAVFQGNWVWYLFLGIAMTLIGFIALGAAWLTTLTTVILISVLLIISGLAQVLGAFWARRWSGFFALLLIGIFYLVVGIVTTENPIAGARAITLLIAAFLIVGGTFRIVAALMLRFPNWIWLLVNGVITLALGILIWRHWPEDEFWVIGMFVGIELVFNGWTWVMFAITLRSLPRVAH